MSGGVDSVVLSFLLRELGFDFSLAHCNFHLRGKSSDADERFCVKLAKKMDVKIHVTHFDTKKTAEEKKLSTQMAARELRYDWFHKLMEEKGYSHLLTAHHAGDNTETVLINLLRGTGVNGLKGIRAKNGYVVRPLLSFTKEEIFVFAQENKIKFREDKSNSEEKYLRNYLRLKVIPRLKKVRPDIDRLFLENSDRFTEEAEIVRTYVEKALDRIVSKKNGNVYINRESLENETFRDTIIHYLLSEYGFNETQEKNVSENLAEKSISGKKYFSSTHELHLERNELVISPVDVQLTGTITIREFKELQKLFKISKVTAAVKVQPDEMLLDKRNLIFPLTIRSAEKGDKFRPFGMNGFKLLSDFYKDKKMSQLDKKQSRLLVNGNGEIMWVIGYRSDNRYKVDLKSNEIIKLKLIEGNNGNI